MSTAILQIGYDSKYKVLIVEFKGSGVYHYDDVPESVYDEFVAAESKGRFFNAQIRNRYDATRDVPM